MSKVKSSLVALLTSLVVFAGVALFQLVAPNPAPKTQAPKPTPLAQRESTQSATASEQGERAEVIKVIDGDTFEISGGQKVRLVGIDTPETVDPRRPVGCFGKEASNEAKKLLWGKEVILQKDVSDTDKYGRLLRYVYLSLDDGKLLFVNDYLVREGFAKVYTYPPDVKFNEQFLEAQTAARENQKGLWKKC